jgi:hypothetical protein
VVLSCPFSLWEKARMRETPALIEHLRTLTPPWSKKLKLFLLGKKTVGFLSQPLLPKSEDSLRE